jgi:type III secretion protein J
MTLRFARLTIAFTALAVLAGCSVELQHDLAEDDANDIYVLLQKNGIEAKKLADEGGNEPRYVISVAKGDVAAAAELLREYSLPRPKADGLSVFKKMKGMIPTQTEERAMFIEALGGEVSNALNRVPGVLEARTIVMIPEVNDLTQPEKKPLPSASVFVKYRPVIDGKTPLSDDQIKSFVATAVPEMRKEAVTVLMTQAMPPESEVNPESRQVTVLGLRMAKQSADQFKVMVAVAGLLVLAMAGFTTFNFVRGGNSGQSRGRQRVRPPEA